MSQEDCIGLIVIVILIWFIMRNRNEGFSADMREFLPVGFQRYGLRGDPIRSRDARLDYIQNNRNIRLSHTGGEMWQSNSPPTKFLKDCQKVPCPHNGEYDSMDTCWRCGDNTVPSFKTGGCVRPHIKMIPHDHAYCDGYNKQPMI